MQAPPGAYRRGDLHSDQAGSEINSNGTADNNPLTSADPLTGAIDAIGRGFAVFPVGRGPAGKAPLEAGWQTNATLDIDAITAQLAGTAYGYAVACGPSGLLVVDDDTEGGLALYAATEDEVIPPTFTVATGRPGGRHHYFRCTAEDLDLDNSPGALRDFGCDVRGKGGYVIGVGSMHRASGNRYRIEIDAPVADLPRWVAAAIRGSKSQAAGGLSTAAELMSERTGLDAVPDVIRGPRPDASGERHSVLYAYACSMRARSIPIREATTLLLSALLRCEQPPVCLSAVTEAETVELLGTVYRGYPPGFSGQVSQGPGVSKTAHKSNESNESRTINVWQASELPIPKDPEWLAVGHIPRYGLTPVAGDEGIGKSLMWVYLAAHITTGRALPEIGLPEREPRIVAIAISEDSWATVRARLIVAGADLALIDLVAEKGDGDGIPRFPGDEKALEAKIRPGTALLVLDAWLDMVPGNFSIKDPQQARAAWMPLRALSHRLGLAILPLVHTNRLPDASIRNNIGGSASLRQMGRSLLFADKDDNTEGAVWIGADKGNDTGKHPAVRYEIEVVQVRPSTPADPGTVARLANPRQTGQTISQLREVWRKARKEVERAERPKRVDPVHDEIEAFLTEQLSAGPVPVTDMRKAVNQTDFSWLRVAKVHRSMGGSSRPLDKGGPWQWFLPQSH